MHVARPPPVSAPHPGLRCLTSGTQPAHSAASVKCINSVGEHIDVVSVELA